MSRRSASMICAVLAGALSARASDPCDLLQAELASSDGLPGDQFGGDLSLHGDLLAVGAPFDDDAGPWSGSAHVFVRAGGSWSHAAKLLANDGASGDVFGVAVATDGTTIAVGASSDDDLGADSGSVYVFEVVGGSWTQTAKLLAGDGAAGDAFGWSVALDGDTILVGAPEDDDQGLGSGAAYVFVRGGGGWAPQAKLVAPGGSSFAHLGEDVALSADTAVFGAPSEGAGFTYGSAYVYERVGSAWHLAGEFTRYEGAFGSSVAVRGDTVLVGRPWHSVYHAPGSVYVYTRAAAGWSLGQVLQASDGADGDRFGAALALSEGLAAVGAPSSDGAGPQLGAAYLLEPGAAGWIEATRILPLDLEPGDRFGFAVAVSDRTAVVGLSYEPPTGPDWGAARVYVLPPESGAVYCTCPVGVCANPDALAGCANSTGGGARLVARGGTFPDEVELLASGGPPGQPAMLFQGDGAVFLPFGDGYRCAAGNLVRITRPPITISAEGTAGYGPCAGDPSISSVTGVPPGSGLTKRYQLWYRDPGGPCGTRWNLSNGYAITW